MFKDRMARAMIEPLINKMLHDLKEDPERSLRNVIDLILSFPNGRFSNNMFQIAQKMLTNESSAYYTLMNKIVSYLDMESLKEFAINAGYNACTSGAKTIRRLNEENNCCIPWMLTIETNKAHNSITADIIAQAKEIGINIFTLIENGISDETIELFRANKECAFVLFTDANFISDKMMKKLSDVKNILISIHGDKDELSSAADLLRHNNRFFSVFDFYTDDNYTTFFDINRLNRYEDYTETFLFCVPLKQCSPETYKYMRENCKKIRDEQNHAYIMMDTYNDSAIIDKMLCGNGCYAIIDIDGNFYSNMLEDKNLNINEIKLFDIFKRIHKNQ